jgi:hypothetical protein
MRINIAPVDWEGDVRLSEKVASLWVSSTRFNDHVQENEKNQYAQLARDMTGYGQDLESIRGTLSARKIRRIELDDEIHKLSNSPGQWESGLSAKVKILRDELAQIDASVRTLEFDAHGTGEKIAATHKAMNALEKIIRQRVHAVMATKAQAYSERAWGDWLKDCPVPDLLMPMVLSESMAVEPVRQMLRTLVEASQAFDSKPLVTEADYSQMFADVATINRSHVEALPVMLSGGLSRQADDFEALLGVEIG